MAADDPDRREFVRQLALLGLGAMGIAQSGCRPRAVAPAPPDAAAPPLQSFTPDELRTLSAACERLLPRDQDPGALDLGVPGYIDRALAAKDLAVWREL